MPARPASSFRNKVVVVTGASAGIGRSICIAFAKEGAHVGMISRNRERLKTLQQELETYPIKTLPLQVDVADADKVFEAADTIEKELGPIDIWVNNAMVSVFSPVSQMKAEEYKRVTDVTYLGFVYGTLASLKY